MRKHALLLLTILLCAAGAISLSAPKGPSLTGGPVGACFVAASKYDAALAGKEQIAFDPGAIQFEGLDVPYDAEQNTVYISQNCDTSRWKEHSLPEIKMPVSIFWKTPTGINSNPSKKGEFSKPLWSGMEHIWNAALYSPDSL